MSRAAGCYQYTPAIRCIQTISGRAGKQANREPNRDEMKRKKKMKASTVAVTGDPGTVRISFSNSSSEMTGMLLGDAILIKSTSLPAADVDTITQPIDNALIPVVPPLLFLKRHG